MRRPATTSKPRPVPRPGTSVPVEAINHQLSTINYPAWLLAALLGLATILAYQPVWHAGFIWDDESYVTGNLALRNADGLGQIWLKPTATPQYYPLVHTSFWLEYHLWGLHPLGYHLVNVLLHVLAAFLLWRVLLKLNVPGAWLAAGIFALHPVNVESVAWVTERKNILAAVFYFATVLAYWRWRTGAETSNTEHRTPNIEYPESEGGRAGSPTDAKTSNIENSVRYFAAFGLFIAALLSKTVTCSFPAAMLLVIWWKRGRLAGRDVWPLLPFFGAGMALGAVTSWLERTTVGASGPEWAFSFSERCLIAGRAVWFYAGKLFWPANLTFIYPRWQINTSEWWQWIFPLAALAVLVLLWGLRHRLGRGPLAAALFFGGTLFPALGFANIYPMRYSFVADHYQYLAGIGLIVLAVGGLGKILRPIPWGAVLLPLGLGVLTWNQAHIYRNLETLWRDTLAKNPACWMAHNNLGNLFLDDGRVDDAMSQFQEAIRLNPNDAEAHYNLATALERKGRMTEAIGQFQKAIRLEPDYAQAHNNLGSVFYVEGQTAAAIEQYQEALRLSPDDADAHYNLGVALLVKKGQVDEAIRQFQEAIRLNSDQVDLHVNLGTAFFDKARFDEAIEQYQRAIQLKPDYAEAHYDLGNALFDRGRVDEAIAQFEEALRLKPDFVAARDNLNRVLGMKNAPVRQ